MSYQRKTIDEFNIEGYYEGGWEVLTTEATRFYAKKQYRLYRQNEPLTPIRIRKVRVKKSSLPQSYLDCHYTQVAKSNKEMHDLWRSKHKLTDEWLLNNRG